jgi:hypothetical protein
LERLVGIALLGLCALLGCEGRAEIHVTCKVQRQGVVCTADHVQGNAAGKACWDLSFTCQNGTKAKTQACQVVEPKGTEIVRVDAKEIPGFADCDQVADYSVDNLKITRPD